MTLALQKGALFQQDFARQAGWYLCHANDEIAQGYLDCLNETLRQLAIHPAVGRVRRYRHPELRGLRSFRVNRPFQKHLIFYRHDQTTLHAIRVIHGARDLPRRLLEPPGENDD